MPRTAEVTRNTKGALGPDEHSLATRGVILLDQHERIDARDFRMPRDHIAREITLERCEPERPATVMLEDELHGAIAEPTKAVVEENRSVNRESGIGNRESGLETGDSALTTCDSRPAVAVGRVGVIAAAGSKRQ